MAEPRDYRGYQRQASEERTAEILVEMTGLPLQRLAAACDQLRAARPLMSTSALFDLLDFMSKCVDDRIGVRCGCGQPICLDGATVDMTRCVDCWQKRHRRPQRTCKCGQLADATIYRCQACVAVTPSHPRSGRGRNQWSVSTGFCACGSVADKNPFLCLACWLIAKRASARDYAKRLRARRLRDAARSASAAGSEPLAS